MEDKWPITFVPHKDYNTNGGPAYTTMVITPFKPADDFRFTLVRKNIVDSIIRFFGTRDIEVGDADFDHDYIINSNDEQKLQALFSDAMLRSIISSLNDITLRITDNDEQWNFEIPKGGALLFCFMDGFVKDIEKLRSLHAMFQLLIQQLSASGFMLPADLQGVKF